MARFCGAYLHGLNDLLQVSAGLIDLQDLQDLYQVHNTPAGRTLQRLGHVIVACARALQSALLCPDLARSV